MGVGALLGGIIGSAVMAHSAQKTQAANAAAQADINEATMAFNAREAAKARDFSAFQADIDRSFNAEQSLIQREWAERLSNSSHQREVEDLKAAGLNPILSANGQGSSTPSVAVASHSTPGVSAASVSGLQAYKKDNVMGTFVSSVMEGMRLKNDYMRAEAEDKKADAAIKQTMINDKKAVQEIEESISRVGLNYDQHELNEIRKRGESAQAKLFEEKIVSEVQDRLNKTKVSEATVYNLRKCAEAAGTAAYAQARIAEITDRIQSAESPERINKMRKEADYFKSLYDKNSWIISDPKSAAQRKWWKENPEAAHANEMLDIIGNVVHGSVGIHGGN